MDIQELKNTLLSCYNYKIELHAHTTPASRCSEITPKEMVETYKNLGYDALTVTNHFTVSENLSKADYIDRFLSNFYETKKHGETLGLKVYLGAEIRFTENSNDYLIYGVNKTMLEEIYDFLTGGVENFRNNYLMKDSVFIQAHPMRNGMEKIAPELLDGIEVFNMHPGHNSRVGLAALYAKKYNYSIITAGSDYHHPNRDHEGLAAIRTSYLPDDTFSLAKLLKEGNYLLEIGRGNIIIP